jgi:putative tryptophan/tyrosine transport system substrate-binding protein
VGKQKAVSEHLAEGAQQPARRRKQEGIDDVEASASFPGEQYRCGADEIQPKSLRTELEHVSDHALQRTEALTAAGILILDDHNERLPELTADLVARRVAVIVVGGGTSAALAAKAATTTIPIVFTIAADPVRAGLVRSLNRPAGNITGIVGFTDLLIVKRLELVTQLVPDAFVIGALINPRNPNSKNRVNDLRAAASALRLQISIVGASSGAEFDNAFATAVAQRAQVLIVQNDALFSSRPDQLAGLAMRYRLPTIFENHEDAVAGGLMSYGPSWKERYRVLGSYAGRILKGEKPADLPVQAPTKFELVINLRTAKALDLTIPPTLLARADEVIE